MRRRHGKVSSWLMVVVAALSVVMFVVLRGSGRFHRVRFYEEKLAAAKTSERAFQVARELLAGTGFVVDSVNDPNGSGLVGLQSSPVTYGRNDLSDALTTLNANFSAALVEMLHEAGARRGDRVGISWDATYPALNIQLLAVCQSLGLEPVIVTAQSGGMWGANYPGMTWLDIEAALRDAGLWDYRTTSATLGGESDDGRGLPPLGRDVLAAAAEKTGVGLFVPVSLAEGVQLRIRAFEGVRAVVSVGRVGADVGDPMARVPSRVLSDPTSRADSAGTIAALLRKRIPVVFLGNPSRVALDHGLPVAPVPLPEIGKGRLFFQKRYSVVLAAVFSVLLLGLLWLAVRYDIEWYLGDRRKRAREEAV